MAITFTGTSSVGAVTGNSGAAILSIECSPRSKVKVDLAGILAQLDSLAAVTTAGHVMPLFTARKFAGSTSGGVVLTKNSFDSQQTSDPYVIVRQSLGFSGEGKDIAVSGTPLTASRTFSSRNTSIYGQVMYPIDMCVIKRLDSSHIYLLPGESMIVAWVNGTQPVGGSAIFNIAWQEDSLGTEYTISGAVTLSGSAVSGAKVLVVTDTDRDLPAPELEVLTTGAPGTWTKTLASGVKASVFVQSRDGETLYTDEGAPYIAKP